MMETYPTTAPFGDVIFKCFNCLIFPGIRRVIQLDKKLVFAQKSRIDQVGILDKIDREITVRSQCFQPWPGNFAIFNVMATVLVQSNYMKTRLFLLCFYRVEPGA